MIRWPQQPREEYEAIQRGRTAAKWTLNGITREEVEWYRYALPPSRRLTGPILCLGVRNGLEVDLFRDVFALDVQGVELHEQGVRPDVWIGSFDAIQAEWERRFPLLYSNALDHAYDPAATAEEWRRVATPWALLALSLSTGNAPTATDPIADITLDDLRSLFGGGLAASHTLPTGQRWLIWRLP